MIACLHMGSIHHMQSFMYDHQQTQSPNHNNHSHFIITTAIITITNTVGCSVEYSAIAVGLVASYSSNILLFIFIFLRYTWNTILSLKFELHFFVRHSNMIYEGSKNRYANMVDYRCSYCKHHSTYQWNLK